MVRSLSLTLPLPAALLLLLSGGIGIGPTAFIRPASAQPCQIANEEEFDIKSWQVAKNLGVGVDPCHLVIERPGAAFVAPQFGKLEVPRGSYLLLADGEGNVVERLEGNGHALAALHDHGAFWASSAAGEVLQLICSDDPHDVLPHGGPPYSQRSDAAQSITYTLKKLAVGSQALMDSCISHEESICNVDEADWAQCLEFNLPAKYDMAKAVARLIIAGSSACTGWLVKSKQGRDLIMTNEHCIATQSQAGNTNFEFMAEGSCSTNCNSWGGCPGVIRSSGGTLLAKDGPWDYAIVDLGTTVLTNEYGALEINPDMVLSVGQDIYIPQHPAAWGKRISHLDADSNCYVQSTTRGTCTGGGLDLGYYCDTQGGSSGSPVLDSSTNQVIAIHHCGNCPNRGVKMSDVCTHLASTVPDLHDEICTSSQSACGVCNDGIECTDDTCDEVTPQCVYTPNNLNCVNDPNGEVCSDSPSAAPTGCVECTQDVHCDDNATCTVDTCDASTNACVHDPAHAQSVPCDDGIFCNGAATCDPTDAGADQVTGCVPGTDPCPGQVCDEVNDQCLACMDASDCNDGIDCTDDSCDGATGTCVNAANDSNCAGDPTAPICSPIDGCVECTGPEHCDDGIDCTDDTCDGATGTCASTPNNNNCADPTAPICSPIDGCVECTGSEHCDDGNKCTVDGCDTSTNTCSNNPSDSVCVGDPDGPYCDMAANACVECRGGAQYSGECDDGIDCTDDSCVGGSCVNAPNDANCIGNPNGEACSDSSGTPGVGCVECVTSAAHCSEPTRICDASSNSCVECTQSSHCGGGNVMCSAGNTCIEIPCSSFTWNQCNANYPCRWGGKTNGGTCSDYVACLANRGSTRKGSCTSLDQCQSCNCHTNGRCK